MVAALESGKVGGYGADVLDDGTAACRPSAAQRPQLHHHPPHRLPHLRKRAAPGDDGHPQPHQLPQRREAAAPRSTIKSRRPDRRALTPSPYRIPCPKSFHVVPVRPAQRARRRRLPHSAAFAPTKPPPAPSSATEAARHGIRTHNAIKALHLDDLFGSDAGGCVPGAEDRRNADPIPRRPKSGTPTKNSARPSPTPPSTRAIELADQYGIGQVSVDNAFHYLWGGGYVMEAAKTRLHRLHQLHRRPRRGRPLRRQIPHPRHQPALLGLPHHRRHRLPASSSTGPPPPSPWAASSSSNARASHSPRTPPSTADGQPTTDPNKVAALLPFGAHKGYGLVADQRNRRRPHRRLAAHPPQPRDHGRGRKAHCRTSTSRSSTRTRSPPALFAQGRNQAENIKAVLDDILGHGNENLHAPRPDRSRSRRQIATPPAASSSPKPKSTHSTSSPKSAACRPTGTSPISK